MSLSSVVRGSGLPVLFLHGLSADHKMMLALDSVFDTDSRPWERHYIDLPGSGRSRRLARMTAETVIESVCEYVDSNFGQPVFALVGVSYGAFIARALHARYEPHVLGSALLSAGVYPAGRIESAADHVQFESQLAPEDFMLGESVSAVARPQTGIASTVEFEKAIPVLRDRYSSSELLPNFYAEPYPEQSSSELLGGRNLSIMGSRDSESRWQDQFTIMDFYCPQSYAVVEALRPRDVQHLIAGWMAELD